ncbi:hypothetical protein [Micromonospora fulviviridis]|uniref:Uncharacterized protein n=1 Tax=Micromonospora fulviviridis TaxID=47860 RepID=A0ABV2VX21_9ACTN
MSDSGTGIAARLTCGNVNSDESIREQVAATTPFDEIALVEVSGDGSRQ